MENPSGQKESRYEKASNWKKRTELPQVLSDGQKSQKVGTGTRHGNPEITSGLYCCFNVMETFLEFFGSAST